MQDEQLAARLRVAVARLHRRLRQESVAGLTPTQVSALTSVSRLGTPTLGEVAAAEMVQPPTMTRVLGGLEEAGLVDRHPDPADRRVSRVALTAEGAAVLHRARTLKTAYLVRQLTRLDDQDRVAVAGAVAALELMAAGE